MELAGSPHLALTAPMLVPSLAAFGGDLGNRVEDAGADCPRRPPLAALPHPFGHFHPAH